MSGILRVISGIYLIIIWVFFGALALLAARVPVETEMAVQRTTGLLLTHSALVAALLLMAVIASIPAIILYAFGQIVGDVRTMTNHLASMRRYYEPNH